MRWLARSLTTLGSCPSTNSGKTHSVRTRKKGTTHPNPMTGSQGCRVPSCASRGRLRELLQRISRPSSLEPSSGIALPGDGGADESRVGSSIQCLRTRGHLKLSGSLS
jgi:hypothetical protein